jgi:uncharacterized protein (TIGR03083 family)
MDIRPSIDDHVAVIDQQGLALADRANAAGLEARVPTCPQWTVRDLVAHQGMVHRWAAANLRGDTNHDTEASHAAGLASATPLAWYTAGLDELIATIEATPNDAEAMVFLKNAPPPRQFWARRQAHETAIHSVDALAASLGRWPRGDEVAVSPDVAADGIDELLMGFLPRRRSRLRSDDPVIIAVETEDTGNKWTVRLSTDPPETARRAPDDADARFTGSAVALYLGLWNRGDEIAVDGRSDVLDLWRSASRIRWS